MHDVHMRTWCCFPAHVGKKMSVALFRLYVFHKHVSKPWKKPGTGSLQVTRMDALPWWCMRRATIPHWRPYSSREHPIPDMHVLSSSCTNIQSLFEKWYTRSKSKYKACISSCIEFPKRMCGAYMGHCLCARMCEYPGKVFDSDSSYASIERPSECIPGRRS